MFTSKAPPSDFYGSFVGGKVKLDIRQLPAPLVLSIALSAEKQNQQNVQNGKVLRGQDYSADDQLFGAKLNLSPQQDAEMLAARANTTDVVRMLHDLSGAMLALLLKALQDGKLCVVDISRMRGSAGFCAVGHRPAAHLRPQPGGVHQGRPQPHTHHRRGRGGAVCPRRRLGR